MYVFLSVKRVNVLESVWFSRTTQTALIYKQVTTNDPVDPVPNLKVCKWYRCRRAEHVCVQPCTETRQREKNTFTKKTFFFTITEKQRGQQSLHSEENLLTIMVLILFISI